MNSSLEGIGRLQLMLMLLGARQGDVAAQGYPQVLHSPVPMVPQGLCILYDLPCKSAS